MLDSRQIESIEALLREVGSYQRHQHGTIRAGDIVEKSLNQLVTFVDVESEKRLVEGLAAVFPKAVFLTEEGTTEAREGEFRWVIDPLDGTTNFLFGLEHYALSVALMQGSEVRFGAIYLPRLDRYFMANGSGAFCNNAPIKVGTQTEFAPTLIATGFPYYTFGEMDQYLQLLEHFMRRSKGVRRLGSAATDLAYTASGNFDLFFEMNLSPWDVAAGAFIVEQAGGKVCGFDGLSDPIFGKTIVAGNPTLVDHFIRHWNTLVT